MVNGGGGIPFGMIHVEMIYFLVFLTPPLYDDACPFVEPKKFLTFLCLIR